MDFINIKDKEELNNFLQKQEQNNFLQSWEWGVFQENLGYEVSRIGIIENKKLQVFATLIKKKLFFNKNYFYCPRGPVMNAECRMQNVELLLDEIFKIAKQENVIFLRFEPTENIHNFYPSHNQAKFYILNSLDVQPSQTLILNLKKDEKELLDNMHQKTRYNIRLAKKKGVEIAEAKENDFDKWWEIMSETSGRDGFRTHDKKYYQQMLALENIKLYLAKYQNKIIAGNIISFFGDMATYVHGASSNQYRNIMAPYLLQWYAIQEAKKKNCKYYDFFGISEEKWPGVTRFKKGFGGDEKNYPGTFDLIFNKKCYYLYKFLRKLRRIF